jgi:hypothetical protein
MKYVRQKRFYISRIVSSNCNFSSNISNSSTRNFKYDQECKKSAFEDNVKLIIKGIEYAILNADLEGTARPKTGAANAGDFGANASDYASFSIDSLDPITISLTGQAEAVSLVLAL